MKWKSNFPITNFVFQIDSCDRFRIETRHLKITDRTFSLLCEPKLVIDLNVTEKSTGLIYQFLSSAPINYALLDFFIPILHIRPCFGLAVCQLVSFNKKSQKYSLVSKDVHTRFVVR